MTLTESLKLRKLTANAKKERLEAEKEEKKVQNHETEGDPKHHMGLSKTRIITNTIGYIILVIMSFIWLIPFFCLLCESFRCESTSQVGYVIPQQWGFKNYINLFTNTNFPRWFMNTLIVALFVSVFQTLFVLAMSYGLSRLRFKGRKFLMNFMLILGMFPGFLTLILLYKLLNSWHMTNENAIWGMIVVYVASSGMGYYVSKGFFDTISKSLDEAARIDGASRLQIFYKIIMPLSKPIIIYTVLTAFMGPWGDFIFAKYLSHATSDGMNVAVGLQNLISTPNSLFANYTTFCAGGIVVALPVTILFMFLQKYYVEGVTGGAVKG
jgi:arabinogalactan oligomer / maltooligosaccharide transport system permease protein